MLAYIISHQGALRNIGRRFSSLQQKFCPLEKSLAGNYANYDSKMNFCETKSVLS